MRVDEKANLVSFLMYPVTFAMNAFVVATLWGWFVVPLGLDAIGKAQALGLSLLVAYFRVVSPPGTRTPEECAHETWYKLRYEFISAACTLLVGAIAHGMMR